MESVIEPLIDKNKNIAVLCGGMSNERDVSLRSGNKVLKALKELGYKNAQIIDVDSDIALELKSKNIEVCYNALHGKYGEDGCIQGLLDILGIPYTGCSVMSSAICMDKEMTKNILAANGLNIIKSVCIKYGDNVKEAVKDLNYPLMIKPSCEGSSIGMTKVDCEDELFSAIDIASKSDRKILIEEYLQGDSCTAGVLEDVKTGEITATPILQFKTKTLWYDFEAKYTEGLTRFILPADFDAKLTEEIQDLAVKAHKACDCKGLSRVDFLVYNNTPYVLEINTSPGMTDLSDLPAQAKCMGIDYNNLVQLILNTAMNNK